MSPEEKDRLIEVLFYLYFDTKPKELLEDRHFWATVNSICQMNKIDSVAITRAVRILMADENKPTEKEMYYLLHKIGLTVRPIRRLSGVYWQKQKAFEEELAVKPILVKRTVVDVIIKRHIRHFLKALYDVFGCLIDVDVDTFNKIL